MTTLQLYKIIIKVSYILIYNLKMYFREAENGEKSTRPWKNSVTNLKIYMTGFCCSVSCYIATKTLCIGF